MCSTKIFAAYLPQYHETEENNLFWGKGYTDWVAVKKAKPLFEGHVQPKLPHNSNFYDLSDVETIRSQADLARKNGISGFNIYHYWFKDGKQALQKPAELLLAAKDIEIEYFFTWDNSSWVRSWSNIKGNAWAPSFEGAKELNSSQYLMEFDYGDEVAWKNHFDYLLKFFKDSRYLKIDNKPVFMFFSGENEDIDKMKKKWDELACENGFDGVYIVSQKPRRRRKKAIEAYFIYQPTYSGWGIADYIHKKFNKYALFASRNSKPKKYDYDTIWRKILRDSWINRKKKVFFSCFVSYDDTPRRGIKGKVVIGESVTKFSKYFEKIYRMSINCDKEILLITAWNEWGEGAYLEYDMNDRNEYLEAISRIVISKSV